MKDLNNYLGQNNLTDSKQSFLEELSNIQMNIDIQEEETFDKELDESIMEVEEELYMVEETLCELIQKHGDILSRSVLKKLTNINNILNSINENYNL